MNYKTFKKYILISSLLLSASVFLSVTVFSSTAWAASLSVVVPANISVGERIYLDVLVDPEGQSINSVESNIIFSNANFDFSGFSAKQSSIPVWVEEPKEKIKGQIHFSGVIPGGLERIYDPLNTKNRAIPIVRLFFIAKKSGPASFSMSDSQILKNDGKGTALNISTTPGYVNINMGTANDNKVVLSTDKTAPLPFIVSIIPRSLFGKTPPLAVFSAEDQEGGIDHYEVAVGDAPFSIATSPYALPYRLFPYNLTVRAFDFSGNVREQQITVSGERSYGMGLLVVAVLLGLGFIRYRFYNKKKP